MTAPREPWSPSPRVNWDRHSDLLRTQIQETGRVRLSFLSLQDLTAAIDDLGIDRADVRFSGGYALVQRAAGSQARPGA